MEHSYEIRTTKQKDVRKILEIFNSARQYMRANNNWSQWGDNYPGERDILQDINQGHSFVGVDRDGEIFMTFALIIGEDPTYKIIRGGNWLNDEPYGNIHRIASSEKIPGVLEKACKYAFQNINNLRIDTHEDNRPMLNALGNLGFVKCGIINCRDGSPRIAFQKIGIINNTNGR